MARRLIFYIEGQGALSRLLRPPQLLCPVVRCRVSQGEQAALPGGYYKIVFRPSILAQSREIVPALLRLVFVHDVEGRACLAHYIEASGLVGDGDGGSAHVDIVLIGDSIFRLRNHLVPLHHHHRRLLRRPVIVEPALR